jgi:hypothetical protein
VGLASSQKLAAGAGVRFPSIQVPDPAREEFEELGRSIFASISQNRGNGVSVVQG